MTRVITAGVSHDRVHPRFQAPVASTGNARLERCGSSTRPH
jgi:hypothetical protein